MIRIRQNVPLLSAAALFAVLYLFYNAMHPKGFSTDLFVQNANESIVLMLVGLAQTLPVLLGAIDLSVGALMTLADCVASELVSGPPAQIALGMLLTLGVGLVGGLLNGLLVVYARIQAIVVTLATAAIYIGIALFIRPTPGGNVDGDLSWVATNGLGELDGTYHLFRDGQPWWFHAVAGVPVPFVVLLLIVLLIWLPFRNSVTGRGCYAVGSAEGAAFMSGLNVNRCKLAAFALGGLFSGFAGLYFAVQTASGNADATQAAGYTLNSIAAVVIGGTSLFGGAGGVIGTIFGVGVLRAIAFCFRVFDANSPFGMLANPLLQPFFEGVILLLAVSLGAARVFRVRNRLSLFS